MAIRVAGRPQGALAPQPPALPEEPVEEEVSEY